MSIVGESTSMLNAAIVIPAVCSPVCVFRRKNVTPAIPSRNVTGPGLKDVLSPTDTSYPSRIDSLTSEVYQFPLFTTVPDHLERYTALAVGPGIGTEETTRQAMLHFLEHYSSSQSSLHTPLILDADALNLLSPLTDSHFNTFTHSGNIIITPHAREYERLFGDADPAEMARRHNIIVVKKAHRTRIYAPDGRMYENTTGNAGMATAGSGDVLTGILLGITAQKTNDLFESVCHAVRIHGQIGDNLIQKQTESSLIASDLVNELKNISTEISNN